MFPYQVNETEILFLQLNVEWKEDVCLFAGQSHHFNTNCPFCGDGIDSLLHGDGFVLWKGNLSVLAQKHQAPGLNYKWAFHGK